MLLSSTVQSSANKAPFLVVKNGLCMAPTVPSVTTQGQGFEEAVVFSIFLRLLLGLSALLFPLKQRALISATAPLSVTITL